jgi:hypothetical protein
LQTSGDISKSFSMLAQQDFDVDETFLGVEDNMSSL